MQVGTQEYVAVEEQSIWTNIRTIQEWGPAISYIQAFLVAKDSHHKALVVADAAEWLAAKTQTKFDDELVSLVSDILKTPQGEALVVWAQAKIESKSK
jgi:hypothetical protein